MQEPKLQLDANEPDVETLDGSAAGVSAGRGVLASMLSWIRGSLDRHLTKNRLLGGVPTSDHQDVDPKAVEHPENFSPALLMDALLRYNRRYEHQLHGAGLLLRIGQELPVAAFPITDGLARFGAPLETGSYRVEDYKDLDAAIGAIEAAHFSSESPSGQLAWLVNAAMLRAAVSMACFVYANPRLEIGAPHDKHALAFDYQDKTTYAFIDSNSSPLSLHRQARHSIQGIWRSKLSAETVRVANEFISALESQGLPATLVEKIQSELEDVLQDFKPLVKMQYSADAFINTNTIFEACSQFAENFDRLAARNALRHGTQGLQWPGYLVHVDSGFKAEIATHESAGGLAYAGYSQRFLESLHSTNGTNRNVRSLTLGLGSGGAGTIWGGSSIDVPYSGHLTGLFMKSLSESVSPMVRQAFMGVSPRYLYVVACGHPKISSFEDHLLQHESASTGDLTAERLAAAAGKRLATALNQVASSTASDRNFLPWARVLSSRSCYEMLISAMPDEQAVAGLVNLISYTIALRAKGARANDEVWSLPAAEDCMIAPAGNGVGSLMGFYRAPAPKSRKAALHLVRDLVASVEPVTTQHLRGDGSPSRTLKWDPELASLMPPDTHSRDLAGGFRLALRNPGTRKGGTWALLDVTARASEDLKLEKDVQITGESIAFTVRGKGTPEDVAPLVMEVRMLEQTRFRAMANRKVAPQGWSPIEMWDISGCGLTNPYMATRIAEADLEAIPDMQRHAEAAIAHWAQRVGAMLVSQPFQCAAAFPAVARFLCLGGRTADEQKIRQVSVATAFKLARACLSSNNPYGMRLLCRYVTQPAHRSTSGVSLLDLALDSTDHRVAKGALEGLLENSRLAQEPGGLAALVQASFGKIVERHAVLIPMALQLGAKIDEVALQAWSHLHPKLRTPAIEAAINEAVMLELINRAAPSGAAVQQLDCATPQPSACERPRRRAASI